MNNSIIFDPVCGSARGHNYKTTIKYAKWVEESGRGPVEIWIPKSDCDPAESPVLVEKRIPWAFEYFLPTKNKTPGSILQRVARKFRGFSPSSRAITLLLIPFHGLSHALSSSGIRRALAAALSKNPPVLFLPGADIYSILGLLHLAKSARIRKDQRIVIRLMGVMETAAHLSGISSSYLHALQLLLKENLNIIVTGETEKYCAYLERRIKTVVPVTHIPLSASPLHQDHSNRELPDRENAVLQRLVVCLGGARADKGYFEIVEYAKRARLKWGKSIHFLVQGMASKNTEYNPNYEMELSRCLNITMLPTFLEDEELFHLIEKADAVFLPYSQGTYEFRGSAILFDSLPFGNLIIGRRGTGFGDSIDSNGLGLTFEDWNTLDIAWETLISLTAAEKNGYRVRQIAYHEMMNKELGGVWDAEKIVRLY